MRQITLHHVGDERVDRLAVLARDEPGPGGACHDYYISNAEAHYAHLPVSFQRGPVCAAGVNGITNEALLAIVADRLRGFQSGPMPCQENADALYHVEGALIYLKSRTLRRLAAGVEGRGKP